MNDRGMKKWMAYKSLNQQEGFLNKMKKNKARIEKPLISSSKAEEINEILSAYHGEKVVVSFYFDGEVKVSRGTIEKIDTFYNLIKMNDIRILFKDIVDVVES